MDPVYIQPSNYTQMSVFQVSERINKYLLSQKMQKTDNSALRHFTYNNTENIFKCNDSITQYTRFAWQTQFLQNKWKMRGRDKLASKAEPPPVPLGRWQRVLSATT